MTVVYDGIEYLPLAEVARRLATTELRVLMLLKQEALTGEMVEGSWFLTSESVSHFDAKNELHAQQPSCRISCTSSGCGCR